MSDGKNRPECSNDPVIVPPTRRQVIRTAAVGAAALSAGLYAPLRAFGAEPAGKSGETLVKQLYGSLSDAQKKTLCFAFDHELRSKVDANWRIVKQRVGEAYTADQQDLIHQIFRSLHAPEYADAVLKQVAGDTGTKGLGKCAAAIFGEPDSGKFEFVMTGRHMTRRCDGDSVEGAAFGGPIFYGHAAKAFNESPKHEGNAYWYQALTANKVYAALDGKQQLGALAIKPRRERGNKTVEFSKPADRHGIACSELTADQRKLVRDTLGDLLAPFRKTDADEALKLVDKAGGVESLHMAFYKDKDLGGDGIWDVWQIEGPNMVCYFRGNPHVHAWVNITAPAAG